MSQNGRHAASIILRHMYWGDTALSHHMSFDLQVLGRPTTFDSVWHDDRVSYCCFSKCNQSIPHNPNGLDQLFPEVHRICIFGSFRHKYNLSALVTLHPIPTSLQLSVACINHECCNPHQPFATVFHSMESDTILTQHLRPHQPSTTLSDPLGAMTSLPKAS